MKNKRERRSYIMSKMLKKRAINFAQTVEAYRCTCSCTCNSINCTGCYNADVNTANYKSQNSNSSASISTSQSTYRINGGK